jgi:hypothetical protein
LTRRLNNGDDADVILGDPVIIKSPSDLRPFLSSPHTSIGIVNALSVDHIISKSRMMELGPVLFVPAPAEVEAWGEDLSNDAAAWDWLLGVNRLESDASNQEAVQAAIPDEISAD